MKKKIVIGVTGGLASGKSTVAGVFASFGARVIDADRVGHGILEGNKTVIRQITDLFGKGILDGGKINRKKLKTLVFFDAKKLKELNKIMHPRILEKINKEQEAVKTGAVVIDAPLLIESGLYKKVDYVVLVRSAKKDMVKRAVSRGMRGEEARAVISLQLSERKKRKAADFVINNNGDMEKVKKGAGKLWKRMVEA